MDFNCRVYEAFYDNIPLLATKERLLKLIDLLQNVQSATGEVILKAQQLTCAAFSGLSFLDQDSVALEIYKQGKSLREYLGLQEMQTMTVFNRITALRDDQVLYFSHGQASAKCFSRNLKFKSWLKQILSENAFSHLV